MDKTQVKNLEILPMRKIITIILFLTFIVILFLHPVKTSYAVPTPCFADEWFLVILVVDKRSLPPGVQVITLNDSDTKPYDMDYTYAIRNDSSTPFYLIKSPEKTNKDTSLEKSELPPGIEPLIKIVSGSAYTFNISKKNDWYKSGGTLNFDKEIIDTYILKEMGISLETISADNRPASVQIPSPQRFSITEYYGQTPVSINGTIAYKLNPHYDPQKEASCYSSKSYSPKSPSLISSLYPSPSILFNTAVFGFAFTIIGLLGIFISKLISAIRHTQINTGKWITLAILGFAIVIVSLITYLLGNLLGFGIKNL